MIDGNILKFGYGDIAVGSSSIGGYVKLQQFKPPEECGSVITNPNIEYMSEKIVIDFTCFKDFDEILKQLKEVKSRNISTFEFKGYIFDFTNYNEKSVEVCERHTNNAMKWYLMCCAA